MPLNLNANLNLNASFLNNFNFDSKDSIYLNITIKNISNKINIYL